jgi:RNA 3'-terminal phosphate cyclase
MGAEVRKTFLGQNLRLRTERTSGRSTGAGVALYARFDNTVLGADGLGERGVPSEQVGRAAANGLGDEIAGPGTLDRHASDQLLAYMALASGRSVFRVGEMTEHLRTQMWLIKRFLEVDFVSTETENGEEIEVLPSRTSPE